MAKITACVVVYNEEKVIERCLNSIKELVDEIVVVHDGDCTDTTLKIAGKFTEKVFIRPHIGEAEPHRVFALNQAMGDWILQIDGDEYLEIADHDKIKELVEKQIKNGYIFQWELWNGEKAVHFRGLQKMCLFKKSAFHYIGIPHEIGSVDGGPEITGIFLRHRPVYNNISWESFLKKKKRWVPIHAKYFFPDQVSYECFNVTPEKWIERALVVRKKIYKYIIIEPIKMLLGQLKNGLLFSWYGWETALQQYVYYQCLYWHVWKMEKQK